MKTVKYIKNTSHLTVRLHKIISLLNQLPTRQPIKLVKFPGLQVIRSSPGHGAACHFVNTSQSAISNINAKKNKPIYLATKLD